MNGKRLGTALIHLGVGVGLVSAWLTLGVENALGLAALWLIVTGISTYEVNDDE